VRFRGSRRVQGGLGGESRVRFRGSRGRHGGPGPPDIHFDSL